MMPGSNVPVVITPKAVQSLHLIQSVLSGLQVIAAASILGDAVGAKGAALFIVAVQAIQQGVNYYVSKTVAAQLTQANDVVARAEHVTEQAAGRVTALAAAMPANTASRALLEHERKNDG